MRFVLMLGLILWANLAYAECASDDVPCLRIAYAKPSQFWIAPTIDESVQDWQELSALPKFVPSDEQRATIELGRALFFEPLMSADDSVACAHCHRPEHGYAEPNAVSTGVFGRQGRRNASSLLHLANAPNAFFWDGRAPSMSVASLLPIEHPDEMAMSVDELPDKLAKHGYADRFQLVFGREIEPKLIAAALGAYLQSLAPNRTRFDEFLAGDVNALNDQELMGLHLFRTKARCMNCHFGAMMTDNRLHNLNQTLAGRPWQDFGRYETTGKAADFGKFKTPSLRNLSQTKPWFHHGLFVNLRGVVAIYNIGMMQHLPKNAPDVALGNHLDPLIQPLFLNDQEQDALVAFLLTL